MARMQVGRGQQGTDGSAELDRLPPTQVELCTGCAAAQGSPPRRGALHRPRHRGHQGGSRGDDTCGAPLAPLCATVACRPGAWSRCRQQPATTIGSNWAACLLPQILLAGWGEVAHSVAMRASEVSDLEWAVREPQLAKCTGWEGGLRGAAACGGRGWGQGGARLLQTGRRLLQLGLVPPESREHHWLFGLPPCPTCLGPSHPSLLPTASTM